MPDEYPATATEVLDDEMKFKPGALSAVRAFGRSKPWRGTVDERSVKFEELNRALAIAYAMPEPRLVISRIDGTCSGTSSYNRETHTISLRGRLSVLTFLHEFAHARGMGERGACRWSINLFRRCFPTQYAKLLHQGHMLVRRTEMSEPCEN